MTTTAQDTPLETLYDRTAAGVRELNDHLLAEARKAGNVTLDAYESVWRTYADYTEKVGAASPIGFVVTATAAHAKATRELSGATTKAARALIS